MINVNGVKFPSPCGEVVWERIEKLFVSGPRSKKVSIPLRGSSLGKYFAEFETWEVLCFHPLAGK